MGGLKNIMKVNIGPYPGMRSSKTRKVDIRIDKYDTWNMDYTLSLIILPMLKQLKETKHGSPWTDDEDVPEELRSTSAPPKEHEWDTDSLHFQRWDWILDEMIWAFELNTTDNWEGQFHHGVIDFDFERQEDGTSRLIRGANDTSPWDKEGQTAYATRMRNGFRLFGKYFSALWD